MNWFLHLFFVGAVSTAINFTRFFVIPSLVEGSNQISPFRLAPVEMTLMFICFYILCALAPLREFKVSY